MRRLALTSLLVPSGGRLRVIATALDASAVRAILALTNCGSEEGFRARDAAIAAMIKKFLQRPVTTHTRYHEAMRDCCEISDVPARQRRVLQIVLVINAAMFLVEFGAGLAAHSTALLADSVDMLGDAFVYGFSLYVVGRGSEWQGRGAFLKGAIMAAFAVGVVVEGFLKITRGGVPAVELMSTVGLLALGANASVLVFLWRRRADDINMRSAWLCSRNDVVANIAVVIAAGGVALTGSAWPDMLTGLGIAALFGVSAASVMRTAWRELRVAPRSFAAR